MSEVMIEMPRYRCHKEVWALKIEKVVTCTYLGKEGMALHPEDKRYAPIKVDLEWGKKHAPTPGGYYVAYSGGYRSFSPAAAFEAGYTRIPQ